MDFDLYRNQTERPGRVALWGVELEFHPEFDPEAGGFVPVRLRTDWLGEGSWMTGFELVLRPFKGWE